jgi:hypothetical protein
LHLQQGEFKAKLPLFRDAALKELETSGPFDVDLSLTPDMVHGIVRCLWSMDAEDATFAGLLLDFSEQGLLRVAAFTRAVLQVGHYEVPHLPAQRLVLSPKSVEIFTGLSKEATVRFAYSRDLSTAYLFADTFVATIACLVDSFPSGYQKVLGLHRWREGTYPIPSLASNGEIVSERPRTILEIDRDTLVGALTSVTSVLGKEDQIVAFRAVGQISDGKLVVELSATNTTTKAVATEKILATGTVLQQIELGLNSKSMQNVLRRLEDSVVSLHIGRNDDPVVIVDGACPCVVAFATLMRL